MNEIHVGLFNKSVRCLQEYFCVSLEIIVDNNCILDFCPPCHEFHIDTSLHYYYFRKNEGRPIDGEKELQHRRYMDLKHKLEEVEKKVGFELTFL